MATEQVRFEEFVSNMADGVITELQDQVADFSQEAQDFVYEGVRRTYPHLSADEIEDLLNESESAPYKLLHELHNALVGQILGEAVAQWTRSTNQFRLHTD